MTRKERGSGRLDYLLLHSLLSSLFWAPGLTDSVKCGIPGSSSLCKAPKGKEEYKVGEIVNYTYENRMVYTRDPLTRRCDSGGVWSGKIPTCFSKIETESFWKEHVEQTENRVLYDHNGNTCVNIPKSGFHLKLKKPLFIQWISVSLEGPMVTPKYLKNSRITEIKNCYHTTRTFPDPTHNITCEDNFQSGEIRIIPIDNHSRICEIEVRAESGADCLRPDTPLHAHMRRTVGVGNPSTYKIECEEGYKIIGADELSCIDGAWIPSSPKCEIIDCGIPEVPNGKLVFNSTLVNSSALLECNEGHMPLDVVEIHCLPTGSWTSNEPRCILIECDSKPHIPNGKGRLLQAQAFYGLRLQIICDKGYAAKGSELRQCLSNGTWGHIDICEEISCDSKKLKHPSDGKWIYFNETNHIKVLVCDQGYHIYGFPAISLCQSNGLWSSTSATCKRSGNEAWINGLSPNTILMIAIAVGAGTAILVLSLAMCLLMVKKERHKVNNSSVFHVGTMESSVYDESNDKAFFKTNPYEDVMELRNNPTAVPRKPGTALPLIPIDTDPVYAQPFEATGETVKVVPSKNTADLYTAHIYAEPVDSQLPKSALRTSLAKESWLQNGAINLGRKISLPGQSQTLEENYAEICKSKTCSSNRSSTSDTFKELNIFSPKRPDTFTGLINNSIYLDLKDRSLTAQDDADKVNMISNDIYLENFSQA